MTASTGPQFSSASTLTAPAQDAFAITPSNSTNFSAPARAIYCGVGGDIVVITPSGNQVTFVSVPTGSILPVAAIRVNLTNTTATSLIGLI